MTVHQRRAQWVATHPNATPAQQRRASLYAAHPTKTTVAAMAVLFNRVCAA